MVAEQRFVDAEELETLQLDWGTLKWLSTPDVTGAEQFSTGVVVIEPGEGHLRHTHPDSEEVIYFLEGRGVQTIADEEREVSAGDTVYIPAGVEHSTENTSWDPLRFLLMYAPPGPEEKIRAMDETSIIPPGEPPE